MTPTELEAPIKILIVDDHPLMRDGLKAKLAARSCWTICGEAEMPVEAIRLVRESKPTVVIIDLSLKDGNGLELIKQIAAMSDAPRMLICSMHDEYLYAQRAIHAGALGYLHKQRASDQLVEAIERILEGQLFLSDEILQRVLTRAVRGAEGNPIEELTDRELQVFEAIGRGISVSQIGSTLFLSPKTVETYRDRIKRKLNLRNAAELLRYAVKWTTEYVGG